MVAPIMPHVAEEMWERLGQPYSVHQQAWPAWDAQVAADEVITLVAQINGKVRARLDVPAEISAEDARAAVLAHENVQRYLEGKQIVNLVYVPGKLVNIVAR